MPTKINCSLNLIAYFSGGIMDVDKQNEYFFNKIENKTCHINTKLNLILIYRKNFHKNKKVFT